MDCLDLIGRQPTGERLNLLFLFSLRYAQLDAAPIAGHLHLLFTILMTVPAGLLK